jgi:hypothetical protein
VLLFLVRVAGQQRGANPCEDLVVEGEPIEHLRELRGEHFFPDVGLRAFPLEACAMVVDVPLLLTPGSVLRGSSLGRVVG